MPKNVLVTDCERFEVESFLSGLNKVSSEEYECISFIANGARKGKISDLLRYLKYFYVPLKVFFNRKEYNVIIGWQQFYAIILSFYLSIFKVKKINTIVALNFTYKSKGEGLKGKIYKRFMAKAINEQYLDYIHVPSNEYADIVSTEFKYPREKIIVTPFGIDDIYPQYKNSEAPMGYKREEYALAIGRSNRDYDFLIKAWENVNFQLVIISDTYKSKAIADNVKIIDNVSGDQQYPWIANSKMVIIPIDNGNLCSGDTVLLTSMSFKKKVVVTSPSTLGEMYIEDQKNGYLKEKDVNSFAKLINGILNDASTDVAENARKSFIEKFSREGMGIQIAKQIYKQQ